MREFNTFGPCNPDLHYTVMREALVKEGIEKIEKGRYFTIFAPRQAGKTTYFELIRRKLKEYDGYTSIWISFENFKELSNERFYSAFGEEMKKELEMCGIKFRFPIKDAFGISTFFEKLVKKKVGKFVLIIDEFEGIPDSVIGEVMHSFRKMYHKKEHHCLHSLILVGVSNLAEVVTSHSSPFNIVDEIRVPYFSRDEVQNLIDQYTSESGQKFEERVIHSIYFNTSGQPGLVNALCQHLVEKVVKDRSKPVTMNAFYETLDNFLRLRRDKNISNIVSKALQKKELMFKILFEEEVPFTINDPDIEFLHTHGVIEERDGFAEVPVPIYSKVLITAFRPLFNGEKDYYITSAKETFDDYIVGDELNIKAILDKYASYVRRRGFKAFDTEHLKESACHYSLDGFINFFIERLGGKTLVETPTGRGRTDILILFKDREYIIETKIYTDNYYFEKGKKQLVEYLKSENLSCGYYVVFSNKHSDDDTLYSEENIDDKKIYTWIIRTNLEPISK